MIAFFTFPQNNNDSKDSAYAVVNSNKSLANDWSISSWNPLNNMNRRCHFSHLILLASRLETHNIEYPKKRLP